MCIGVKNSWLIVVSKIFLPLGQEVLFWTGGRMGVAVGCFKLGGMYYLGNGVRLSTQTALEYFGKACDMKLQEGCEIYATVKKELGQ